MSKVGYTMKNGRKHYCELCEKDRNLDKSNQDSAPIKECRRCGKAAYHWPLREGEAN